MDKSGLSRSQVYRKFGHLRIQLGPNSAGWIEAEIESEIKKLIAASRGGAEAAEKTGI
jgi:predicted DNA-binding transcriptional regulator AlpA